MNNLLPNYEDSTGVGVPCPDKQNFVNEHLSCQGLFARH
jgi:hypothetical protein